MYKPSRHQILLNDPGVTVTLSNGEEVKLMPMDPHDKPNKRDSLLQIAKILGASDDAKDWNNLPAFLEGLHMAKYKAPHGWTEKIVRKANERGKAGVIQRCAEMVRKTGLRLSEESVAMELMIGCHLRAAKAGFVGEEAEKALKRAERIVLLMENPQHCGAKLKKGEKDMRRDLGVLGVLLELTAAKAVLSLSRADPATNSKVVDYAKKASTLLDLDEGYLRLSEQKERVPLQLQAWLPLWAGMKLALQVPGMDSSDVGRALKRQLGGVTGAVAEAKQRVEREADGKPRRSLKMYEELKSI